MHSGTILKHQYLTFANGVSDVKRHIGLMAFAWVGWDGYPFHR
jgi:hypothetical protein